MRLATFLHDGKKSIGIVDAEESLVFPLGADLPTEMVDLVALGDEGLHRLAEVEQVGSGIALDQVQLLAPLRPRNNIMCVGKNYVAHAHEFAGSGFDASQKQAVPDHPVVFTKALSSIVGPGDAIAVSEDGTGTSDYEGELGVVIGKAAHRVSAADAWEHVYGYVVINDMTVRALQKKHVQFFIGKSARTYCPMGPWLVTRDEIPDITAAWVRTSVDGEERQAAPVSDLIFSIPTLIETLSATVALEPGDVIATGTPAGVGIGFDPPRYLAPGQVVTVSVDGVGTLSNPTA